MEVLTRRDEYAQAAKRLRARSFQEGGLAGFEKLAERYEMLAAEARPFHDRSGHGRVPAAYTDSRSNNRR